MGKPAVMDGRDPDMTGAELRVIRSQCGVTLEDFGQSVGVTGKSVRGWEVADMMLVPRDVADKARELHVELLSMKQDVLSEYADCEPGDEVVLVLYRPRSFEGPGVANSVYNAAAGLAFNELVDDGLSVWVEWR